MLRTRKAVASERVGRARDDLHLHPPPPISVHQCPVLMLKRVSNERTFSRADKVGDRCYYVAGATGATTTRFIPSLNSCTILSYFAKCQRLRHTNHATLVKCGDYSWFRTALCRQSALPLGEPLTPAYSSRKSWLPQAGFKPPWTRSKQSAITTIP